MYEAFRTLLFDAVVVVDRSLGKLNKYKPAQTAVMHLQV
jgi:hypothetical protein